MLRFTVLLAALSLTFACATPYQPEGYSGGYSEIQLSADTFRVSFRGNGYISADAVNLFWLRRCAEITKAHSARYFVVADEQPLAEATAQTAPTTCYSTQYGVTCTPGQNYVIRKYGRVGRIRIVEEKTAEAVDADMLLRQLGPSRVDPIDEATRAAH